MRKFSNFEDAKDGDKFRAKQDGVVSSFSVSPPIVQSPGSSFREARLFRKKKGYPIVERERVPSISEGTKISLINDFKFMREKEFVPENGQNGKDAQNILCSEYIKKSDFYFNSEYDRNPKRGDTAGDFARFSPPENRRSALVLDDPNLRCEIVNSVSSKRRKKNIRPQRVEDQSSLSTTTSVVKLSAGLSLPQCERFRRCMEGNSLTHNHVRLKVLQLLKNWMGTPSVRSQIINIVHDTFLRAGINNTPVKDAWCIKSKAFCCNSEVESTREAHANTISVTDSNSHASRDALASSSGLSRSVSFDGDKDSDSGAITKADRSSQRDRLLASPLRVSTQRSELSEGSENKRPKEGSLQKNKFMHNPLETNMNIIGGKVHCTEASSSCTTPTHSINFDDPQTKEDDVFQTHRQGLGPSCSSRKCAEKVQTECDTKGSTSVSRDGSSGALALTDPPAPVHDLPGASYEDIPQFYFPLGRRTTQECVISDPLSSKIQNPHLAFVECVPLTNLVDDTGRPDFDAFTYRVSSDKALTSADPTMPSMSTLRCVDDKDVSLCLQKEFSRLPSLKPSSKAHSHENSRNDLRKSVQLTKREANYQRRLLECIGHICTNCFGIPRYFAFVILSLFQNDLLNSSDESSAEASGRSTLPSSMHGTPISCHTKWITVEYLQEFYEVHLKGKDIMRRTFDLLILSSYNRTSDFTAQNNKPGHRGLLSQRDTRLRSFLLPQDFVEYINQLLQNHPGLSFLKKTPEFRPKYIDTVIYRIFYELDRYDRGQISFAEFSSSRLLDAFRQVDEATDINTVLLFFSYEHFYVLYCRFWELDEDCDLMLSEKDFSKYFPDAGSNPLVIQRIFNGVGRRIRCEVKGHIGYEDFVWFCLSEEDKSTPQAIRYWFRILDLDEDGILSIYEMHLFYNMAKERLSFLAESFGSFNDFLRQVFDMLRCPEHRSLTLVDLLREHEVSHVLLGMLTNFIKLFQYSQGDPLVAHQQRLIGGPEQSHWDRFARVEYDRMAQETDV